MADIKILRTRIKSVESTLHLTDAMGLVASSKIRRASDAMLKSKQYAESVSRAVSMLAGCRECARSPYLRRDVEGRDCLVVIAGDRGLAGGYNANVFRTVAPYAASCDIIAIGKRACDRFGKGYASSEKFRYSDASELAARLCEQFASGKTGRVGIVCTEYVSTMTQNAVIRWLFPLTADTSNSAAGIIFEPDAAQVLDKAVPEYVAGQIYAAVRESFASEVTARRMAMDSAGKNAHAMLDGLRIDYNRARQGAITQQITEIVAGGDS